MGVLLWLAAFLAIPLRGSEPPPLPREAVEKRVPNPTVDQILQRIDSLFGAAPKQTPRGNPTPSAPWPGWRNVRPTFNPRFLGGNSSGGGSVIERNGRWHLLDTYVFPQYGIEAPEPDLQPSRLERTPFHETAGVDIWDMEGSGPLELVSRRVREVAPPQTRLALLILGILRYKVKFFFTFDPVKRYSDFYLPTSVVGGDGAHEIRTVILYDRLFGPVIDARLWNELDLETQAGLLIHEAFRFLRMVHPRSITESQLQQLTTIFLSGPDGKLLPVNEILGPPLLDSLRKPGWNDPHQTAEGTRFRLYFRRMLEQMTHLREVIDGDPKRFEAAAGILESVPAPCRTPETHEKDEVDCGAWFLGNVTHWRNEPGLAPEARELIDAMELKDGNAGLIWEIDGKPSYLFPWFYHRLGVAVGVHPLALREIRHPWLLRAGLNAGEPLSAADQADAEYFAGLVKAYFEARVWKE